MQPAGSLDLEPTLAAMVRAMKRIITPSAIQPDGSVPRTVVSALDPWDNMRYVWRGGIKVSSETCSCCATYTKCSRAHAWEEY